MQKQKFKYFFKMAAIAAILDFGPSPKSNGMILGPFLIPPPSFVEIRRGVFSVILFTNKQTNKQTERGENSNLRPSSMAEVNYSLSKSPLPYNHLNSPLLYSQALAPGPITVYSVE